MSAYVTAITTSTTDIRDQQILNQGIYMVCRQKVQTKKVANFFSFLQKFLDLLISLKLFNRHVVVKAGIKQFSLGN